MSEVGLMPHWVPNSGDLHKGHYLPRVVAQFLLVNEFEQACHGHALGTMAA
jgi:hypothetical protein